MRRVIDGLAYDTETAEQICDISGSAGAYPINDFNWEDTWLYRTKKGAFFISGSGGALSRWATDLGDNKVGGGSGVKPVTEQEARTLVEKHGSGEDYDRVFGPAEEA
jgi:hypothetical protein